MTDLPYWTLHEAPPDSPKKWAVRVPTSSGRGKVVLFGARGYEDFTTHHDVERRERYRTRHQRDRLDDPYAPGFWSMWALWGESDDLDTAFAAAVSKAKKLLMRRRRNPTEVIDGFRIIDQPESIAVYGPSVGLQAGPVAETSNINPGVWWISRVLVPKQQRGQGIGTFMLNLLQQRVAARPDFVKMIVAPGGYDADPEQQRNFYLKAGFREIDPRRALEWEPVGVR